MYKKKFLKKHPEFALTVKFRNHFLFNFNFNEVFLCCGQLLLWSVLLDGVAQGLDQWSGS